MDGVLSQIEEMLNEPFFLYPVLPEKNCCYEHVYFIKDENNNSVYAIGMIKQEKNALLALFSIQKGWFWNDPITSLLYISADNDPASPVLFADINKAIAPYISTTSKWNLFIQKIDEQEGCKLQRWVYFNHHEMKEFIVMLASASDGGTDFSIILPN